MPSNFVQFPAFRPDLTTLGADNSSIVFGVVPRGDGYGPFRSFQSFTSALPASCRGFFFARKTDGSIAVFAGTSTDLYLLNNTTFSWDRISKGGVSYGTLVSSDDWRFAQFENLVIAVQVNTVPQKFTLGSSTEFADLGGSPPQASHIAIVNGFVLLTGLLSNPQRAQWSDLFAPETWAAGTGLADFQDFPDGGICHQCSGGDAYGVVFQDEAIRTLTYAPGSSVVFQIARISTQDTLFAQYSVVTAGTRTFFISAQGFKVILPGTGEPQSIGKEQVDRFFFGDVDANSLQLVIGAADPQATRVYWAYKSQQGSTGLFDKILCFDWSVKDRPWTLIPMSGQYLGYLAKPGLTLEGLDAIAPGGLTVLGAAAGTAGRIRLTLDAVSNAFFTIAGQNFIELQGVNPSYMNGSWPPIAVDSTHIELGGSTFGAAWVSGGRIGGSLDALTFSLDSISTSAVASLAMVGPSSTLGFFTGPNIEAIVETPEQVTDSFVFIDGITPFTDSPDAMGSIGHRNQAQGAIVYTGETAINSRGDCPVNVEAQFMKARLRVPAGSVWTYARGVKASVQAAGDT